MRNSPASPEGRAGGGEEVAQQGPPAAPQNTMTEQVILCSPWRDHGGVCTHTGAMEDLTLEQVDILRRNCRLWSAQAGEGLS